MADRTLGRRALNRALLARQHLLQRTSDPALAVVEHLVGMQAQAPLAPYIGLWTRIDGFKAGELSDLVTERRVVRASLMRATIHLVSDRDCLTLRPLTAGVSERAYRTHFARLVEGADLDAVLAYARDLLEERPRTRVELREAIAQRWPSWDADALASAAGLLVGTVHVPPRGVWGSSGPPALTTIEHWLGRRLDAEPPIDELVRRYLQAMGPASVKDVQTWSGLTGLREVVDRMDVVIFRDDAGRELYDVPGAPLPDRETPAPVRFLPAYDNVLLSHADRSRIITDGRRVPLPPGLGANEGTVLVDGMWTATWRLDVSGAAAVLRVACFHPLPAGPAEEIVAEGERLLAFVVPDAVDPQVCVSVAA